MTIDPRLQADQICQDIKAALDFFSDESKWCANRFVNDQGQRCLRGALILGQTEHDPCWDNLNHKAESYLYGCLTARELEQHLRSDDEVGCTLADLSNNGGYTAVVALLGRALDRRTTELLAH